MIAASANTFDPNWIIVILLLVGLIAAAVVSLRGGTGTAVAGLQATNRELERQVHTLTEKVHQLEKENAELRGRTDVSAQIAPVLAALQDHETHASARSDAMLAVLNLIASRLGPEA